MTSSSPFSVDEMRGRLLFEQLWAEADALFGQMDWTTPTAMAPVIPHVGTTDTGTMREVVVNS